MTLCSPVSCFSMALSLSATSKEKYLSSDKSVLLSLLAVGFWVVVGGKLGVCFVFNLSINPTSPTKLLRNTAFHRTKCCLLLESRMKAIKIFKGIFVESCFGLLKQGK